MESSRSTVVACYFSLVSLMVQLLRWLGVLCEYNTGSLLGLRSPDTRASNSVEPYSSLLFLPLVTPRLFFARDYPMERVLEVVSIFDFNFG